jgi:hypothetical protein
MNLRSLIENSIINEKNYYMKTFKEYLINEQIIGNTAIVYHRGNENKLNRLLDQSYSNNNHIDFKDYSKGLYTTTSMAAQLNQTGNRNDMKSTYGNFIIKLAFKGVSNCWFCSFDKYKKYNNCTIDNWKEQQFKKFNIDKKYLEQLNGSDKKFTANHTNVSKFFEKYNLLGSRIKGIQYDGKYDGDCLLIYDWTTAVPLAVSNDEGKTWEKVDKSKTAFQRSNFKNNDYIDTDKKIKFEIKPDENGNINCSYKQLTTLRGAPQKVNGSFNCYGNKLTTLEGAPQKVNGDFNCYNNQLTTLEGAPREIGGDFACSENKLTTLKGCPQEVYRHFTCSDNKLTTLEGAPKEVGKNFDCSYNQLTTLKGAPKIIYGTFWCSYNELTTLEGSPKEVGKNYYCSNNQLTTLEGAPKEIYGHFKCTRNNLTTLKGAPQEIDGDFSCYNNKNLSKEEIINYLKTAKIGGRISTDYGDFDNQQKALEKLTTLKESYFNY